MSNLQRRALANSIQDSRSPWSREQWASARRDILAGTYEIPEMRFPVIISPNGPLSSAEQLQELIGSRTRPRIIETVLINGVQDEMAVDVCDLSYDEKERLLERTEAMDAITGSATVLFQGGLRYAVVVTALK